MVINDDALALPRLLYTLMTNRMINMCIVELSNGMLKVCQKKHEEHVQQLSHPFKTLITVLMLVDANDVETMKTFLALQREVWTDGTKLCCSVF